MSIDIIAVTDHIGGRFMNWLLFDAADPGLRGSGSGFMEYLPLILVIILIVGIASAVVLAVLFKKKKRKKE